ncbi:MAG TPA: hypothetical protein VND65_01180 [Candidatus Binatia bacterium]|nr:hypothetical protein [Candidatus Binatia bacterium]
MSCLTGARAFASAGPVPPDLSCGNGIPGAISCPPTKSDLKQALAAYNRGRKFQERKRIQEAFEQFDQAAQLVPQDTLFLSAREALKSQLVYQHTQQGDSLLAEARQEKAAAEFRAALKLDPENTYAQERLTDSLRTPANAALGKLSFVESGEIQLQPKPERTTFQYKGDVRGMFEQLVSAFGIKAEFDDSVTAKPVRFYVNDVDFFTALSLACLVAKTMWVPLDEHQILIAINNAENHKQFDRMALATFAVPTATTPQQATELVTSLRNVCDFQKINSGQNGIVEVRAPQAILTACVKLLNELSTDRPEVSLDVEVYTINHNFTREIGMHVPDTFNFYNIPAVALAGLGGQSISSLVNQLISSGGINQAGSSALSGLLAQLQNQTSGIFSQPLATFGNGLTFSGVSLDHLTTALSLNESWSQSVSRVTLRADQSQDATLHIGERYPILNASYAPIYNSSQISAVLGNQSYVPPFPSVSYEDLGLSIKAKPMIHGNNEVSMSLEMQVRALTGQSANGVPVISNEEFKGSFRLRDGEPAVIAGEIGTNDQRAIAGIPAVADIPGINQVLTDNTRMKEYDELLVILTPHLVANHAVNMKEIWVSQN